MKPYISCRMRGQILLFPTCQVMVVRFYVSCPPSSPPPPPDLNCNLVIAVVPAGPEQQTQDQSAQARTLWLKYD